MIAALEGMLNQIERGSIVGEKFELICRTVSLVRAVCMDSWRWKGHCPGLPFGLASGKPSRRNALTSSLFQLRAAVCRLRGSWGVGPKGANEAGTLTRWPRLFSCWTEGHMHFKV